MTSQKSNVRIRTEENRKLLIVRGVLALLFAYGFGSLAIDSGSYWHYLYAVIAIGFVVNAFGRLVKDIVSRNGTSKK